MADEILIGTEGWRHDAWRGGFYPEELPTDWEFCYYSNRLRAVWLSVAAAEADAAEIGEWLRDSDPAFRFVLSVGLAPAADVAWREAFCVRIAPLQPRLAGIVLTGPVPPALAADTVASAIAALRALAPVCIDGAAAAHAALADLGLTRVWEVATMPTPPWQGAAAAELCLARMRDGDPRAIRGTLEQLAVAPSIRAGLFFCPSAAAAQHAEAARTLAELLGI